MPGIDSFTKLLLHCDGADASTTFTDSSSSGHTVTANGNAQIDTAQSKFGGASYLSDGTGDYLRLPSHADFGFGTGDFTVDLWMRPATTGDMWIYMGEANADADVGVRIETNKLVYFRPNVDYITGTTSVSADTWYHVAVARSGTSTKLFLDGTQEGSTLSDSVDYGASRQPFIGALYDASLSFNGWLDEIRISKGVARWTANFTPPTEAYSATSIPVMLRHYRQRRL